MRIYVEQGDSVRVSRDSTDTMAFIIAENQNRTWEEMSHTLTELFDLELTE